MEIWRNQLPEVMTEEEEEREQKAFLTPPLCLDGGLFGEHQPPNLLRRIFGLFADLRPGSDLTNFQVSHHPPVSALHATDTKENIELIWCQNPVPKFHGASIEAVIHGKRELALNSFGEKYEMDSPNLLIRILPLPAADWIGDVTIQCKKSGLRADLSFYKSKSFLGVGGNSKSVKGTIFHSKTLETIYEMEGQWDRTITLKDVHSGEVTVLYDALEAISKLSTPVVKDPKGVQPTESAVVWSDLSQAILNGDWEKAREVKKDIEERERMFSRERKSRGEDWLPKHFKLNNTEEGGWECWPIEQIVPPAPITVPS